jgi:HAMP domain-containing protein
MLMQSACGNGALKRPEGLAAMPLNSQGKPELSTRLKKTNDELRDLQHSVKTGMINVKVLMEFRNATERARQASAAVQEWLEAQGKGNDPYKLMSQVMTQRVEMATHLLQDVTHDLESGDVDFDTPGLAELAKTVHALADQMRRLFPH